MHDQQSSRDEAVDDGRRTGQVEFGAPGPAPGVVGAVADAVQSCKDADGKPDYPAAVQAYADWLTPFVLRDLVKAA